MHPYQEWLNEVTYKPGYWFEYWFDRESYTDFLFLKAKISDVRYGLSRDIPVTSALAIPNFSFNKEEFFRFVDKLIWQFEHHEIDEWFKIGGVCYTDPHPELRK